MKRFTTLLGSLGGILTPVFFAFAQQTQTNYITNFIQQIKTILTTVIPLLITIAIVMFFIQLIMFIWAKNKGEAEKTTDAKKGIMWSLVALFIMLSFLGIIRILQGVTGANNQGNIDANDIPIVTF